jgi:hypothetical protein
MAKRLLVAAACVAAVVASVSVADAASKHPLSSTVNARVLSSSPSGAIYTGTVTAKGFGEGAVVIRVTAAQAPNTSKSVATAYFKRGTVTTNGTNTTVVDPATNNATFSGSVNAVSGTGIFKGVKGTLKLSGTSSGTDPTYATFTLNGTLRY